MSLKTPRDQRKSAYASNLRQLATPISEGTHPNSIQKSFGIRASCPCKPLFTKRGFGRYRPNMSANIIGRTSNPLREHDFLRIFAMHMHKTQLNCREIRLRQRMMQADILLFMCRIRRIMKPSKRNSLRLAQLEGVALTVSNYYSFWETSNTLLS